MTHIYPADSPRITPPQLRRWIQGGFSGAIMRCMCVWCSSCCLFGLCLTTFYFFFHSDFCGIGVAQLATPFSSLYAGSPMSYINTVIDVNPNTNNVFPDRINMTLIIYVQNGTSFNSHTNVTTAIWVRQPVVWLYNGSTNFPATVQGNTFFYNQFWIDPAYVCGETADETIYTATRCFIRWVYDATAYTNNNGVQSRVSCADVKIFDRSTDISISIHVIDEEGALPIRPDTAFSRLLNSAWATDPAKMIETWGDGVKNDSPLLSQQIRLHPTAPIVVDNSGTGPPRAQS